MNTSEAILSRKAVREYTGEPVSTAELEQILLAAQAAPVAMGRYEEVRLTVVTNPELLSELEENAAEYYKSPGLKALYGAPTLVVVSSRAPAPGRENVTYSNTAIIAQNMILQATELGVGTVHIWGLVGALQNKPELSAKLGLPEGFVPCCGAVFGKTTVKYGIRRIPKDRIAVNYIK